MAAGCAFDWQIGARHSMGGCHLAEFNCLCGNASTTEIGHDRFWRYFLRRGARKSRASSDPKFADRTPRGTPLSDHSRVTLRKYRGSNLATAAPRLHLVRSFARPAQLPESRRTPRSSEPRSGPGALFVPGSDGRELRRGTCSLGRSEWLRPTSKGRDCDHKGASGRPWSGSARASSKESPSSPSPSEGGRRRGLGMARGADVLSEEDFESVMKGSTEVLSMLKSMRELLADIYLGDSDSKGEKLALTMAATGVVGSRIDKLEPGFLVALDAMIRKSEELDKDPKATEILWIIKEQVLQHVKDTFPPQLQVLEILCRTSSKAERKAIICRAISNGGVFGLETGGQLRVPGTTLDDIQRQADDLIADIEEKPQILDRRLLARLVLIREEARGLLSGGFADERGNTRGFKNLPAAEVNFISKLVAMRPGKQMREVLWNVMEGKDEGEEKPQLSVEEELRKAMEAVGKLDEEDIAKLEDDDADTKKTPKKPVVIGSGPGPGWSGKKLKPKPEPLMTEEEMLPVRPGQFLDSVKKVLNGAYEIAQVAPTGKSGGMTVQVLEWVTKETLKILEEMGYGEKK